VIEFFVGDWVFPPLVLSAHVVDRDRDGSCGLSSERNRSYDSRDHDNI
jgi:hypothetical protein